MMFTVDKVSDEQLDLNRLDHYANFSFISIRKEEQKREGKQGK